MEGHVFVRIADGSEDLAACLRIRRVVFIEEQAVPEADELDDLDAQCTHMLALPDLASPCADAVGTARLLPLDGGRAKVQRVAVLAPYRRRGVGAALMGAIEAAAVRRACTELILGSQLTAVSFYERLGWAPYGDEFLDAGIPHVMMAKSLR